MEIANQRIVIWCGAAPNQRALANKLAKEFKVSGIVIDDKRKIHSPRKLHLLPFQIWDRFRFNKIYQSWKQLMLFYQQKYSNWPDIPLLRVGNINDAQVIEFTNNLQPTLIIVSGTGLVKKDLLAIAVEKGILNLHTGLSPFVKGGPNCTNWCIAGADWHLVGNTIMWINAGIDSGNIVTSETVAIQHCDSLYEAQKEVMEHAHDLYARAIKYVLTTAPPYQAINQDSLGKGHLYLTKMWTSAKRKLLLKNWKKRKQIQPTAAPATVALPNIENH